MFYTLNILAQGDIHYFCFGLHIPQFFLSVCLANFGQATINFFLLQSTACLQHTTAWAFSAGRALRYTHNFLFYMSTAFVKKNTKLIYRIAIYFHIHNLQMQRPRHVGHGRLAIPQRGLIRPSENFYLVFAFPLNNHLYTNIVLFLADPQAQFTIDTEHLARCSSFFLRRTLRFRVVDTPSVASEPSDGSA